jgi:hypothetical protein
MPPTSDEPLWGSCLCGGVRFEVTAPFRRASHCHCRPQYHSFVGSRAPWDELYDDGLERFDGPPASP